MLICGSSGLIKALAEVLTFSCVEICKPQTESCPRGNLTTSYIDTFYSESHAATDQGLPTSVCGGSASGDQRSLLLSRCICTAGVPPQPPSSAMNPTINLTTRTSSSSSRVSSSCCPVHSASPTLGSLLYSPLGLCCVPSQW